MEGCFVFWMFFTNSDSDYNFNQFTVSTANTQQKDKICTTSCHGLAQHFTQNQVQIRT